MTGAPDGGGRHRRITELAHQVWESEGQPEGQALRHWRIAERLYDASLPEGVVSGYDGEVSTPGDCAAHTPPRAT